MSYYRDGVGTVIVGDDQNGTGYMTIDSSSESNMHGTVVWSWVNGKVTDNYSFDVHGTGPTGFSLHGATKHSIDASPNVVEYSAVADYEEVAVSGLNAAYGAISGSDVEACVVWERINISVWAAGARVRGEMEWDGCSPHG